MKNIRQAFYTTLFLTIGLSFFTQSAFAGGSSSSDEKRVEKKTSATKANFGNYNFSYSLLNGKNVSLSDFGGKIVLVNIWAPWCGPCKLETPGFVKLYEKYKERGFEIVSVGVSTDEDDVKEFVKKYKITFPVGISDEVGTQYGTRGIPDNFLFSREGKLVKHFSGYTDEKKLEEALTELLSPKPSKE
ncbi:MAG: TlpA disulfide reductase family protein [Bacteroidota bacterium]